MELKSASPENTICWVTCTSLPNTGVGTRELLRAGRQMKKLIGLGLGSELQKINKMYFYHKYSQEGFSWCCCREQFECRLGLSSQKSGSGRVKDPQVQILMAVHDSDTQRCTKLSIKLRLSHGYHHDCHSAQFSLNQKQLFHSQQSYAVIIAA